jgi:hypothetical protein
MTTPDPTTRCCDTCRLFDLDYRDEADLDLCFGRCTWNPGPLPTSWRWTTREVVSVTPLEGTDCPVWVMKPVVVASNPEPVDNSEPSKP